MAVLPIAHAQDADDGHSGSKLIFSLEASLQYHLLNTGKNSEDFSLRHEWHYFPPKLSFQLGWQRRNTLQWLCGITYLQLPNTFITSRTEELPGNYTIRNQEFHVGAKTDNYQFFMAFKKYADLAPEGWYFGMKAGAGVSFYRYQKTYDETLTNPNNNTVEAWHTIYAPKKGSTIHPFIGAHAGKSFSLNRHMTLDAGLRVSGFFGRRKGDFKLDMNDLNAVETNLSRANLRALNSLHLIELYANFSLFH